MQTTTPTRPYRLSTWRAAYITLGDFASFGEALAAYAACTESTKQLGNIERAGDGGSGLTDAELDVVYALPSTRAATAEELAAAVAGAVAA